MNINPRDKDNQIIRDFDWYRDVPIIDPDDYFALKAALEWARKEHRGLRFDEDANDMFSRYDMLSLTTYIDALKRRIVDIETQDRMKLAAWNRGEPIHG